MKREIKDIQQRIEDLKEQKKRAVSYVFRYYEGLTGCGSIINFYTDIEKAKWDRKIRKEENKLKEVVLNTIQISFI